MKNSKINVGITISIDDYKTNSMFSNGIKQNVLTLREVFENCKNVKNSYIINTAQNKSDPTNTVWEQYAKYMISKEEAEDKCDLIVVCQGSLHVENYEKYKKIGKKIVKQILGPEFSIFAERNLFDVPAGGIYKRNPYVDAVWMSPHYFKRDQYFFKAMFNNCDVFEAPYIWDSRFIDDHINLLKSSKSNFSGVYTPSGKKAKRISTMEPNLNVIKTCITPIIIAEFLERQSPELLEFFSIFGGEKIKTKTDMIDFVKNFEINKNKKCFFENRYPVVWTLFEHTDIVLSHQNQNELNYLYLDAAWLGFPVVHNSPMMKELGWYYPENNADAAVEQIKCLAEKFDTTDYLNGEYLKKSREFASQYFPSNPKNIKNYEKLIENVMESKKTNIYIKKK
jgi:hypothetical protein